MKKITLILAFAAFSWFANAQGAAPLAKGGKQLNFGSGLSSNGIPAYVSFDFAIHNDVTLTPQVTLNLQDFDWIGVSFKGDYHWNRLIGIPSNWDFYAGAKVGYRIKFDDNDKNKDFEPLNLGLQVGGRWYWSEKWGLNLELGGGAGGFGSQFGLSMKI